MKFVHIADIHLGKVLHQYSLLDIQKELLYELLEFMDSHDIRTLVMAGDIYDRLIPSQEAVNVLDSFLSDALLKYHIHVLMISGNHDSSDRLHFGRSILLQQGLYIETYIDKKMHYVEMDDVRFYLLPFFKPHQIRTLFENDDLHTYQDAMAYYISQQNLDKNFKNILVTHQFVGHHNILSESEMPLSVGGSEIIDAHVFDAFDYVALGHLHAPQKVSRETMRYSGSLMRYSFDEVKQKKSFVVVDTDDMSLSFHELHPSCQVEKYEGSFHNFMDPHFIENKNNFLAFILTDDSFVPHAMEQLRVLYPRLLQITYQFVFQHNEQESTKSIDDIEKIDTLSLYHDFYHMVKQQDLSEEQKVIVAHLLESVGGKDDYS